MTEVAPPLGIIVLPEASGMIVPMAQILARLGTNGGLVSQEQIRGNGEPDNRVINMIALNRIIVPPILVRGDGIPVAREDIIQIAEISVYTTTTEIGAIAGHIRATWGVMDGLPATIVAKAAVQGAANTGLLDAPIGEVATMSHIWFQDQILVKEGLLGTVVLLAVIPVPGDVYRFATPTIMGVARQLVVGER